MKTRKNINPNVKMSFAAATLFVFSTLGVINASDSQNKTAFERLESMNLRIEEAIKYKAPEIAEPDTYVIHESEAFNFEATDAAKRLEGMNLRMEESIRYQAPAVDDDINYYEVQTAMERLDNMNLAVEQSLRYEAPVVTEDSIAYEAEVTMAGPDNMSLAIEQSIEF